MTAPSSDQDQKDWVLVTGASRGIGRAIAEAIARQPVHVVVNFRSNVEAASAVVDTILSAGGSAEPMPFDVGDAQACASAAATLIERRGAPYGIVNNAGVTKDGLMVWMKPEDWGDVLRTNLDSFYNVTQPFLKEMLTRRRGRIVNITSTAGQIGNPGQVNYSASKAGLIGATQALAKEVAKRKITVNAVAPGFIETDMTSDLPVDKLKGMIPAARFGSTEEVAAVVVFLLAENASYVTGQVIGVNGGLH
jgi:3-oxoacyl-[acyl-carrier protein] reductase